MSSALRATQAGYQEKLEMIDRQIASAHKQIEGLQKQRADVESGKKGIDELVAKLPPEEKKKPAAAAAAPKPAVGK